MCNECRFPKNIDDFLKKNSNIDVIVENSIERLKKKIKQKGTRLIKKYFTELQGNFDPTESEIEYKYTMLQVDKDGGAYFVVRIEVLNPNDHDDVLFVSDNRFSIDGEFITENFYPF